MRNIRNRRKAQDRWDKLRKYVRYTWGCGTLDDNYNNVAKETCCTSLMIESLHKSGSSLKERQRTRTDSINCNRKANLPSEKKATLVQMPTQTAQLFVAKSASNLEGKLSSSRGEPVLETKVSGAMKNAKPENPAGSCKGDVPDTQAFPSNNDYSLPPPPSLEFMDSSEISMSDIKKNFHSLYEYNVMLRERLAATQCMLQSLTSKASSSEAESQK